LHQYALHKQSSSSTDIINDVGEGIIENDVDDLCADVKEFVQDDVEEDSGVDVKEDTVGCYMQPKNIQRNN